MIIEKGNMDKKMECNSVEQEGRTSKGWGLFLWFDLFTMVRKRKKSFT